MPTIPPSSPPHAYPTPSPSGATTPAASPAAERTRRWLVRWLYAVAAGHVLVGVLLPWLGAMAWLDDYHRSIAQHFGGGASLEAARAEHVWWMALFGATVQSLGVWMLALVHIGARHRLATVWLWLLAGLALWAPQDVAWSLQAGVWLHVGADALALVVLVPPLLWLYRNDRV